VERDDIAMKDSLQVVAAYPEYGYDKTVFVDHSFVCTSTSLPENTLLVPEYVCRDDIFLN
jgi:hypothetical protein